MTTLPTAVAASLGLVVFVLLANLVLVQYARGVARTAVDEAVRRAAVTSQPAAACAAVVDEVLDELLGGAFGAQLEPECRVEADSVVATVAGLLPPILPLHPGVTISVEAATRVAVAR